MEYRVPVPDSELRKFFGKVVTKEMLEGRGYFFSKDGKIVDDHRPKLKDFDFEEDEDDDDEITCHKVHNYLAERSTSWPNGCWTKGIAAEQEDVDNHEAYMLVMIETEEVENGLKIRNIIIVARMIQEIGGGWFSIPGQSTMDSHFFEMTLLPPEVITELTQLIHGRYIPEGFTLIGKKMPENKDMFHPNPPYSIAKNSGWRNVYWHLSIDVDDNDVIESVEMSTYERETSMFQRPHSMSDDNIDALDCTVFVCDQYSDEEWKKIIG